MTAGNRKSDENDLRKQQRIEEDQLHSAIRRI